MSSSPGPDDRALAVALAELAEEVARAAGDLVRDQRPHDLGVAGVKSSPTDVVTAMDVASEHLITSMLLARRPHDALLREEGGPSAGTSGLTWVIDPIDGTVNYLYGIPVYAVSVAVVAGDPHPSSWRPVAGCVHEPTTGATWTAAAGAGARLDGRELGSRSSVPLSRALVGTGFGYSAERRAEQGAVLAQLLPRVRDIRRIGSAALDLCAVATGRLDAYYERGVQPWDIAAGWLVCAEAGVDVVGLGGARAGEQMLVAAPHELAVELAEALVAAGASTSTSL